MNIKAKFSVGDLLVSKNHKYIGKVTKMTVVLERVEPKGEAAYTITKIQYTLQGNETAYNLDEGDLNKLDQIKDLELVNENKGN